MTVETASMDGRLLLMNPDDNICIVRGRIRAGEQVLIDGRLVAFAGHVETLHKVARRRIAKGMAVLKFGHPIGVAKDDIAPGDWVHVHNLKSAYIPSLATRGGPAG